MGDAVVVEIDGPIANVRFNRPDRLNAIDLEMARSFYEAMKLIQDSLNIRVIKLSAEGRGFVAGGDLASFHRSTDKPAAAKEVLDAIHAALKLMSELPVISVTAVKGTVAGAGMSIVALADLVIAADNTTFNFAYNRVAVPPDCGGTWAVPQIVGIRKALELALLSETIDVQEAQRLGLVNKVVSLDDLEMESTKLVSKIAAGPPQATLMTKDLIRASVSTDLSTQLDHEKAAFVSCAGTKDFVDGLHAFFEKRTPKFSGQ